MARRKWEPLTLEEEREICKKCEGFCCNYFFVGLGAGDAPLEFHKFRNRKVVRYAKTDSIIMPDPCPHFKPGPNGWCSVYEDRPEVCRKFPEMYAPFWSLKCKLMRERYKRGMLKKAVKKFNTLLVAAGVKPKSAFKHFK